MSEPRINVYVCEYNCHTVTVDVDDGVTPFMIRCEARSRPDRPLRPELCDEHGRCKGTARSSFYPKGPKPSHIAEPTHEWYSPDEEERATLGPDERSHVEGGGLLLRTRTAANPKMHQENRD